VQAGLEKSKEFLASKALGHKKSEQSKEEPVAKSLYPFPEGV